MTQLVEFFYVKLYAGGRQGIKYYPWGLAMDPTGAALYMSLTDWSAVKFRVFKLTFPASPSSGSGGAGAGGGGGGGGTNDDIALGVGFGVGCFLILLVTCGYVVYIARRRKREQEQAAARESADKAVVSVLL